MPGSRSSGACSTLHAGDTRRHARTTTSVNGRTPATGSSRSTSPRCSWRRGGSKREPSYTRRWSLGPSSSRRSHGYTSSSVGRTMRGLAATERWPSTWPRSSAATFTTSIIWPSCARAATQSTGHGRTCACAVARRGGRRWRGRCIETARPRPRRTRWRRRWRRGSPARRWPAARPRSSPRRDVPAEPGMLARAFAAFCSAVDRRIGWDRLPPVFGLPALIGLRSRLRARNLYDTGLVKQPPSPPADLGARAVDGSYNDLAQPAMGSVGTRFGRNIPLANTYAEPEPDLLDPSPRVVSRELLARTDFIPATTLNVLAAAWLQFEVHDWFSHETDKQAPSFELPLAADDPWPERPMTIARTQRDPASELADSAPPVFPSYDSHWWDGSQIYGTGDEYARLVRTGEDGKLRLDDAGLPPPDLDPYLDPPGIRGNFWLGLALLHGLFMKEHNAICDHLRREYPTRTDAQLYDRARLVNSAVMAKIHTVEWSPAVIAHPTTVRAMHVNWYGLVGERVRRRSGRLGDGEVLSGIPGSPTDHHGVPFSLTEEFVAVYRMHPLMPDDYVLAPVGGRASKAYSFDEVGSLRWRERVAEVGTAGALRSLGSAHPGAITLHNFPRFLQEFRPAPGEPVL